MKKHEYCVGRRRVLQGVAGIGALSLAGGVDGRILEETPLAPVAQLEQAEGLPRFFDFTHEININGESALATVEGEFDFETGRLVYTGRISELIDGYRNWAPSPVTQAITGGGPVVAIQREGGENMLTLTDGELGYTIEVTTTDQYADVETVISVERDGDTVVTELESSGDARYPVLTGLSSVPMRLVQRPTRGGFVEEGTKYLLTEDGELIETTVSARYRGISLPRPQVREVMLRVVSESADHRTVELELENSVSPLRESSQGARFGGLQHSTLGRARLSASADSLVVSGTDEYGVSVSLDGAPFLITTPAVFDTLSMPTGASLRFEPFGLVDGEEQPLGVLSVTDRRGMVEYFCDFSDLGAETATVQVRDGGRIVTEVTDITGPVARVRGPVFCDPIDPIWIRDGELMSIVDFVAPREIQLLSGQTVIGDSLVVIANADDPSPQPSVQGLTEMRIVAEGMPSFRILDQRLGIFERPHRALGGVQFDVRPNVLTVGRFDEGGVEVLLDDEREFAARLDPLTLDEGTALTLRASGLVDGRADQSLGYASIRSVDDEYVVSADFSALDTRAVRVEVFDDDDQTGEAVVNAGTVARLPIIDIGGCGKLPPQPLPCFLVDLLETGPIVLGDELEAEGNQLRILAAEADVDVESLSSYSLEGMGLESLSILEEQVANVG